MPDAVVAEPVDVELLGVVGLVELDNDAVADDDSTGGDDEVVQADIVMARASATATPTQPNRRPTLSPLTHP